VAGFEGYIHHLTSQPYYPCSFGYTNRNGPLCVAPTYVFKVIRDGIIASVFASKIASENEPLKCSFANH
jgi:hypothetical protein